MSGNKNAAVKLAGRMGFAIPESDADDYAEMLAKALSALRTVEEMDGL